MKKALFKLKEILFPSKTQTTPFQLLGKKEGIKTLVNLFYDTMDSDPKAKECLALHEKDLTQSREKLTLFLTQWLGGPNHYSDLYGHPRMRMRHMKFQIGEVEKEQWLYCMNKALDQHCAGQNLDEDFQKQLKSSFKAFANHMQNR